MDADATLITELRAVAGRVDPPPAELRDAALWAFSWRTVDSELAELVSDSAMEKPALSGVRADAGPRLLTFEASRLEVEVQITETPGGRRLLGQVVPPQPARIQVRHAAAAVTVDADALGRFTVDDVAPGPVSLRCRLGAGEHARVVDTEWLAV
jgi:hypothetical protein